MYGNQGFLTLRINFKRFFFEVKIIQVRNKGTIGWAMPRVVAISRSCTR
jgi:hypothetical protein